MFMLKIPMKTMLIFGQEMVMEPTGLIPIIGLEEFLPQLI